MSYFDNNNAFGIVTVMDAQVYKFLDVEPLIKANASPKAFYDALEDANLVSIATLKYLTVATLSTDGPSITINGGKYNNPLIKYGKTARCEMTDALGEPQALAALGGAEIKDGVISITDKFGAPVCIVGDTFMVDQATGKHVPLKIVLYKFLPDSTPSFAFDSGNAATFDLNGDLLAVELGGPDVVVAGQPCGDGNGTFFSLIPVDCALEGNGTPVTYNRTLVLVGDAKPSAAEMDEFQFGKKDDILIINNTYTYKKDDNGVWQLQTNPNS